MSDMRFLEKSTELDKIAQDIQELELQKTELEQRISRKKRDAHTFQQSLDESFKQHMEKYLSKAYRVQNAYCRNESSRQHVEFRLSLLHLTHVVVVYAYERINDEGEFSGYTLIFRVISIDESPQSETNDFQEVKEEMETFISEEMEKDHNKRLYMVTNDWLQVEVKSNAVRLNEEQKKAYELLRQGVDLNSVEKMAGLNHGDFLRFKDKLRL